jgi:uncharacterized Zn finger protein (UPF0148 family)
MKIKLSKSQWEEAGKKAGWVKIAETPSSQCLACGFPFDIEKHKKDGIVTCPKCKKQFQLGGEAKAYKYGKEESQKWWSSLSINEMKALTRKYYPDPHITWSFVNQTPPIIEDIYQKENKH